MRQALLLSVAAFIAIAGCGKREREPATGGETTSTAPASSGSTLGERVGPASDPLLAAAAPRLSEWSRRWGQVIPGFSLESLYREAGAPFTIAYRRRATSEDHERARFFGEVSPDSTQIVEPDMYRFKASGAWELWGEPDSAPSIIDLRTDTLMVITGTGPSGGFEDAFWIDRNHAVLVGYGERRFEPWAGGGDLLVLDLPRATLTTYHTPDVTKPVYDRYLKLSYAAQSKRFRVAPPL